MQRSTGGKARLVDGVDVPLPARLRGSARASRSSSAFAPRALRPRAIRCIGEPTRSISVNRAVTITEPLGTETLLFAELGGKEVQGKMLNPRRRAARRDARLHSRPDTAPCLRQGERQVAEALTWQGSTRVELLMVDLQPKVKRIDAIQRFVSQETPIVRITDADGVVGTGYSYTIGTGGHSVMELLKRTLAPRIDRPRGAGDRADLARPAVPDARDHQSARSPRSRSPPSIRRCGI